VKGASELLDNPILSYMVNHSRSLLFLTPDEQYISNWHLVKYLRATSEFRERKKEKKKKKKAS
jgi:hypothetical protein